MRCPHCKKLIHDELILDALDPVKLLRKAGSIGGSRARGAKKAHSSEVARRAARIRWDAEKAEKSNVKANKKIAK